MLQRLDALHARLRSSVPLQRLVLFTRTLIALGFIAPGLTKVVGFEFAPGWSSASVGGAYFEALHATGYYYTFVGAGQVLAGALLLWRPTAPAGALLFLPVIANIVVLTWAVDFGTGTPVVTTLMLLACLGLLVWDAHRLISIFAPSFRPTAHRADAPEVWDLFAPLLSGGTTRTVIRLGYIVGAAGAVAATLWTRGLVPYEAIGLSLGTVGVGGLLTLVGWAWHLMSRRRRRASQLSGLVSELHG